MTAFDPDEFFVADRLEKLRTLRERGVDPYPAAASPTVSIGEYLDRYRDIEEISDETSHRLAGRVHRINDLGGIAFVEIADESGSVQLILDEDTDGYELVDQFDYIDILGATGTPGRSNTGELSLVTDSVSVLSKALKHHHPPSKDDVGDPYVDRAVKFWWDEIRDPIQTRFELTREIRRYLDDRGFLEVETPVLQQVAGGAEATPFETELEARDEPRYLRIATEIHLKRMLVGGFEQIYELGPVFRNEDIDATHNPEYTQLELYEAYSDYTDMMELTEGLLAHLVRSTIGTETLAYDMPRRDESGTVLTDEDNEPVTDRVELDLSSPFERLTVEEAIERHTGIDVLDHDDEELRELALEAGGEFPGGFSRGLAIMELFENAVEHELVQPTFVIDHPTETTPLCKPHRDKPDRIERFELFVAGVEYANAYTELNDPVRQGELLAEQANRRAAGDEEAHEMDEAFVETMGYGMPPAGGLGIGIDRLAMLLTNRQSIKDVIAFPIRGGGR